MATMHPNSPEMLRAEILAEARRESEEIIRRAQSEAISLLAAAKAEADKLHQERQDAAKAEAARRSEMALATVPVEAGRIRSERIESILESVREEARHRLLAHDFDDHETLVVLAAEAVRQMPGAEFFLKISSTDAAAFGGKLAEEVVQRAGHSSLKLSVSPDPSITDGGVIVGDAEGFRIWDNRLLSRLERLWPELRRQIAIQTSLVAESGALEVLSNPDAEFNSKDSADSRQRPGVRPPSADFPSRACDIIAAEGCRNPKPGGLQDDSGKGCT